MNTKSVNWLFLASLLFEAFVIFLLTVTGAQMSPIGALVLNQLILLVPVIFFLVGTGTSPVSLIAHKRVHISTILLTVAYTVLCSPLIIVVNAISMLFVDNAANEISQALMGIPYGISLLVVGIIGPVNEEFIFRGVVYHGYKRSGRIWAATLMSAFLFGLMHLNFNQMSYAFVVGILSVLLLEATDSIWPSMIFHCCINTSNMILAFFQMSQTSQEGMDTTAYTQQSLDQMGMSYTEAMCVAISVYGVIALITTTLAIMLLIKIAQIEGRKEALEVYIKPGRKGNGEAKKSLWSIPLVIAVVLCFTYMIVDVIQSF